jgi:uncharacterized protein
MRPFSLLVKPAGPDCNLLCKYCFYLRKQKLYPKTNNHRMSLATLESMISSYMQTEQPQYAFGWQGGEPTLMGVDFFKKAIEFQKRHGKPGASIANGLQTNGTLIDDDYARLFAKYNFLIGVSLDGPATIHNQYRLNSNLQGTHSKVLKGIRTLKNHNVEFNILVLVSQANVRHAKEVYRYLVDQGLYFHQYIPCVEFDAKGNLSPFSISDVEWGNFMCELYDEWHQTDTRKVSIRHFDSIVNYMVNGEKNICMMGTNCCQYFVVEHNGDIYPCDFFVKDSLKIGNISNTTWQEAQSSNIYTNFGKQKCDWNKLCNDCKYISLCAGDCLKHRINAVNIMPSQLSTLCAGWDKFYQHTYDGFNSLAQSIKAEMQLQRQATLPPPAASPNFTSAPKRNDPCPCGSGKKFKKCCGRN